VENLRDSAIFDRLCGRLRRGPSPSSVVGSLPVLFFGDLARARVVTVSLNPSHQEYLDRQRRELVGAARRFETLASLDAPTRSALTDAQCARAIQRMEGYFLPDRPIYRWFGRLDQVMEGMGFRYQEGDVAHVDLVQEATDPAWSQLQKTSPGEWDELRSLDVPFLQWQLETFPVRAVICNGRTTFEAIRALTNGSVVTSGVTRRLTWSIALGAADDRSLGIVGWNIPLMRPTGLRDDELAEFGHSLAARLGELGISQP
jgi:uracil-DNA glycosylase